jgi:hypothetical protein
MFHRCLRGSPDLGSNDQHTVSRLFFSLEVRGRRYDGLYADVKQPVEPYETGSLEVSPPQGASYSGPFNYEIYRYAAANYYRKLSRRGMAFRGDTRSRLKNNEVKCPAVVEFEASGPDVSW